MTYDRVSNHGVHNFIRPQIFGENSFHPKICKTSSIYFFCLFKQELETKSDSAYGKVSDPCHSAVINHSPHTHCLHKFEFLNLVTFKVPLPFQAGAKPAHVFLTASHKLAKVLKSQGIVIYSQTIVFVASLSTRIPFQVPFP